MDTVPPSLPPSPVIIVDATATTGSDGRQDRVSQIVGICSECDRVKKERI